MLGGLSFLSDVASKGRERRGLAVEVDLSFPDAGGVGRRERFDAAADVLYEAAQPFRSFPPLKGQRNYPGVWWSSTNGWHIGFESRLERDTAMVEVTWAWLGWVACTVCSLGVSGAAACADVGCLAWGVAADSITVTSNRCGHRFDVSCWEGA